MKVDDDVFVQTHKLQKFLDSVVRPGVQPLRNTFMCVVHGYVVVDRDPSHKWYMPRDQYGFDLYPTYCGGNSGFREQWHFLCWTQRENMNNWFFFFERLLKNLEMVIYTFRSYLASFFFD